MEHISFEKIYSYMEGQLNNIDANDVSLHLNTCEKCRGLFAGLKAVENNLKGCFKIEAREGCPEDWEIAAFIKKELEPADLHRITEHIDSCDYCLDRTAIYYKAAESKEAVLKTPEFWKQKAVQTLKSDRIEPKTSISQRLSSLIKKIALLPPMPGYATAALAIIILIIWSAIPQKEKIITIASSEKIITRDSEIPSTYGFTGVGKSREVKNMEIRYKGKDIVFLWKPINRAVDYEFTLRDKSADTKVYSSHVEKNTMISLKKELFEKDRLYGWLITGKTKEGEYFEYMGDFILVR